MKKSLLVVTLCLFFTNSFSESVAIFPVQGVNTDKSFCDAFGLLLANKYENISKNPVINPMKAVKAIGPDSNYSEAAKTLGVDEYIEINAIGLYISLKEKMELTDGSQVVVNVNTSGDDDDEDGNDQNLLDNSKTIVTAYRKALDGTVLHKSELTLLTYGDIEEASERIALSLYKKVSVDEVRTQTNITRREGMGNNKTFIGKVNGIRLGVSYPVTYTDSKLSSFLTIMYDLRFESRKFFLEMAMGGRIPSGGYGDDSRGVGGFNMEVGGDYYLINNTVGVYVGGGINPYIDFLNVDSSDEMQLGVAPFVKVGCMLPQTSKVRFYFDFRVAQNALPIVTGGQNDLYSYDYTYGSTTTTLEKSKDYPTEIGVEMGIAW